ncbi:hypothetical protein PK28_09280 [Hymenobacter sp. DG25B]|uniref:hypothetical protein n=1 Tax=Hymenobacter sp. DG25B TaxID=1385664 RepID=UPI000540DF96|nr:hypothetical protein [Hymenobacter sp. DG25B]AIZ63839.1 hypothetical protein PK28_09280 [Hymenobacter sp. DG25B]
MRLTCHILLLFLVFGSGCASEYRPCPNNQTDPTKQLYQDIVTELIEQRLGIGYLPAENIAYIQQHFREQKSLEITPADSVWERTHRVRFQRALFQDTARFQTFYLNTKPRRTNPELADLPVQFKTLTPETDVVKLIRAFAPSQQQASLDSLNRVQTDMGAADFQLCTAKLLPVGRYMPCTLEGGMGILTLSAVAWNAAGDQGLLSFSWQCGCKCGFGEVLWVEKVNGRWRIKQAVDTWIS